MDVRMLDGGGDNAWHAPRNPDRGDEWVVWRQGDDGNPFEVARLATRSAAEDLVATLEARGHRQVYWIEGPS